MPPCGVLVIAGAGAITGSLLDLPVDGGLVGFRRWQEHPSDSQLHAADGSHREEVS